MAEVPLPAITASAASHCCILLKQEIERSVRTGAIDRSVERSYSDDRWLKHRNGSTVKRWYELLMLSLSSCTGSYTYTTPVEGGIVLHCGGREGSYSTVEGGRDRIALWRSDRISMSISTKSNDHLAASNLSNDHLAASNLSVLLNESQKMDRRTDCTSSSLG